MQKEIKKNGQQLFDNSFRLKREKEFVDSKRLLTVNNQHLKGLLEKLLVQLQNLENQLRQSQNEKHVIKVLKAQLEE